MQETIVTFLIALFGTAITGFLSLPFWRPKLFALLYWPVYKLLAALVALTLAFELGVVVTYAVTTRAIPEGHENWPISEAVSEAAMSVLLNSIWVLGFLCLLGLLTTALAPLHNKMVKAGISEEK